MVEDREIASKLRLLSRLGTRVEDRLMREKGVSLAQSRLMEVIKHTPRARWSDIATVLGYSPRTITDALDALERDGLMTRVLDPGDRRAKILTLTKRGAQDLARAQAERDEVREVIFGVLSTEERVVLLEMLKRMCRAAQSIDTEDHLDLPD